MQLRIYQADAVSAVYDRLGKTDDHVLAVLPTGSGKSLVIAQICHDVAIRWKGRVLVLAHRKELLEQNADKITRLAPDLDVGIYSAGLGRREHDKPIVVAGIQSVFAKGLEIGRYDLVLVDEVHRVPAEGEGMYRTLLRDMHAVNPALRVIGLTATPYRMGTGYIYGEDRLFPDVCFEVEIRPLIAQGFLCRLTSKTGSPEAVADTSSVHVRGGEFIESELEAVMSDQAVVTAAVRETIEFAERTGRKKCLIFACGIKHAEMISATFSAYFQECPAVHSQVSDDLRDSLIARFRNGEIRFLVNPMILTEGFDDPSIDMIALMRATKSPGLYYQMVGRGLRIHPEKADCAVLDFGENVKRHGPVDQIKPKVASGEDAPTKECPHCHEIVLAGCRNCPACGYQFPEADRKTANHQRQASAEPIISEPPAPPAWKKVERIIYYEHKKKGADEKAPRTLRVEYKCGWRDSVNEWVCVEHPMGGFAREKAIDWWFFRHRAEPPKLPANAKEAAELGQNGWLREPIEILVQAPATKDDFPRIIDYKFPDQPEIEAPPADFKPSEDDQCPF